MVTRKFKETNYATVKEKLCSDAQFNSFDGSYDIILKINKRDYILKVKFSDDCKVLIWSATEVTHNDDGENTYTIITCNNILLSLLNILLWQKSVISDKNAEK